VGEALGSIPTIAKKKKRNKEVTIYSQISVAKIVQLGMQFSLNGTDDKVLKDAFILLIR
jgi:hypothetical protein